MKKLLLNVLLCLLLLAGCDKDEDPAKNAQLPEATQEGKNTVGFTFENGEVWLPFYECNFMDDPCGKAAVNISPLAAKPKRVGLMFSRFLKENRSFLSIGNNLIGSVSSTGEKIDSLSIIFSNDRSPGGEYAYPQPGSSFLITRFDRENEIISGTFHLILKEASGGRTVTLSNGRFDYKFNACACD
ncbi:MAG: hypothetical protein ACO1OQ_16560 [Rufibacter sp.]